MSEIIQRLEKMNGELAITIPDEIAEAESIDDGDLVKINIHKIKKI